MSKNRKTGQCTASLDLVRAEVTFAAVRGKTNLAVFRQTFTVLAKKHDAEAEIRESKRTRLVVRFVTRDMAEGFMKSISKVGSQSLVS